MIHLDGGHFSGPQCQLLGERADARADFQHAAVLVNAGKFDNLPGNPGRDQKILSFGFGKMKAVPGQKRLHNLDIAQIKHEMTAFPLPEGRGRTPLRAFLVTEQRETGS